MLSTEYLSSCLFVCLFVSQHPFLAGLRQNGWSDSGEMFKVNGG